ncbi:lysylphosphatidylglycerol synthase transmembrane domain-containing protein [Prevotella sp. AGR2160]|uniref:lysylphosphatidylglycerol synthase transmembrane domain-containing protein n=1 Tax=Prevotella sp. AGR2160 TaxID=1280674 RepID=UPI000490619C|nr:lysylphosphatidylglycerol synthase transmembrane domain-containing protein [Prevotella sp. AGR2160]
MKQTLNDIMKVVFSLLLGGAILYWMYRGFDFGKVEYVLLHEMDWTWMILSFPFGILAQTFRGWRWKQTLTPLGEHPRDSVSINAIFISYASSLLIPRIGEFARCGVLRRWDNVSFSKSLGTVVTERAIDSLLVMIITLLTFITQIPVFMTFFRKTGTSVDAILGKFTATGYLVTIGCALVTGIFGYYLIRKLSIYNKVKDMIAGIWAGITSLRNVKNVPLFIFFTIAIWVSYFLHYYLTFFCFQETSHLSMACALVTFIVGSIAVIVPTPNGAGPWHFAVKTMLILYGVSQNAALYFVLIVHSIQTLLVIVLGIYGWIALQLTARRNEN